MEFFDSIDKLENTLNKKEKVTGSKKYYKTVLTGNYGVGKSCVASRIMGDGFNENGSSTIGASFSVHKRIFNEKGDHYDLHVWDTAGQERFKSVTRMYYRDADIILIVYDLNELATLETVFNYWVNDIVQNGNLWHRDGVLVYLVGNKSDLYFTKAREDKKLEKNRLELIEGIRRSFPNCKDFRISAKNNEGIDILLNDIYAELDSRLTDQEKANGIKRRSSGAGRAGNGVELTGERKWYRRLGWCWGG